MEDYKSEALKKIEVDDLKSVEDFFNNILEMMLNKRQELNQIYGAYEVCRRVNDVKKGIKSSQELQDVYKEVS